MENTLTRISKIAKQEGITITAMEKSIGASKGVLSRALNNKSDIQSKWIQLIVEKYPLYNTEWLLTGKGEMLKNSASAYNLDFYEEHKNSSNTVAEDLRNYESQNHNTNLLIEIIKAKDKLIERLEKDLEEKETLIEAFRSGNIIIVNDKNEDSSK